MEVRLVIDVRGLHADFGQELPSRGARALRPGGYCFRPVTSAVGTTGNMSREEVVPP